MNEQTTPNIIRFIESDELQYLKYMFDIDPALLGIKLTRDEINCLLSRFEHGMTITKTNRIAMMFDEDRNPVAMYSCIEFPAVASWAIKLTKVLNVATHYNISAKMSAPLLDFLINAMEQKGYYKFWMTATEQHQNNRNKVMCKFSKALPRYTWYDEQIISKGTTSLTSAFDAGRPINYQSDALVRLFMLKQKYRVEILKEQKCKDYNGTIIE